MAENAIQAVALFSGGLDSILAARLVMEQGIRVRCLHFCTPFFGKPGALGYWSKEYGLDIEAIDIGDAYIRMLRARPAHGFGKVMNPCVDCKIMMMHHAKARMEELGASFIISGEVLGQRPMSQRRDTLNVIRRDGEVKDILLRPLCAKHLEPTEPERSGLVDRERLESFYGRGRKGQLDLAARMQIADIPTPAGGCRLAEKENARRYWPVLTRLPEPTAADFNLANVGRQGWSDTLWLAIGRSEADNEALKALARSGDILLKILDYPGPLALVHPLCGETSAFAEDLRRAAALAAAYSPKAVRAGGEVDVRLIKNGASCGILNVMPERTDYFELKAFADIRNPIHGREEEDPAEE